MQKKLMVLLVAACTLLGFAAGLNIVGSKSKTYSVREGDAFYCQPSVTADVAQADFAVGRELPIADRLELDKPSAVKALADAVVEDAAGIKYQLRRGDVYRLAQANLEKANAGCVVEVMTTKGDVAKLEVAKSMLAPVDEGTWIKLQPAKGAAVWVRLASRWY